ncbi:MAG: trehalose-phosphatase [Hyphomonas sp.]|nr:trehalose-phosphatase [Hyphomonas sp.]
MTGPDVTGPPPIEAGDAVFLDFDGTLTAHQDDPETVFLVPGMGGVLEQLAGRLEGALALISGRDPRDLERRVPAGLWRLGNHGLVCLPPGTKAPEGAPTAPDDVRDVFYGLEARHQGVRVEEKGPVLALHYRQAPGLGAELADVLTPLDLSACGYSLQAGKYLFEAKPGGANKGAALARMMDRAPFAGRRPVMIGDDTTDEDAFAAANALGGLTIKVGDGRTQAACRLGSVGDVHDYLRRAAGA